MYCVSVPVRTASCSGVARLPNSPSRCSMTTAPAAIIVPGHWRTARPGRPSHPWVPKPRPPGRGQPVAVRRCAPPASSGALRQALDGGGHELGRLIDVHLHRRWPTELVATLTAEDHRRPERAPQLADQAGDVLRRLPRWAVAPQRLDDLVGRHRCTAGDASSRRSFGLPTTDSTPVGSPWTSRDGPASSTVTPIAGQYRGRQPHSAR